MRYIQTLKEEWKFEKLDSPIDEGKYTIEAGVLVTVPHTWNTSGNIERTLAVYERKLVIDKVYESGNVFLEFLGANSVCRVYLNEDYIGEHRGGYSTFRFDITTFYKWNEENILRVYVDNSETQDVSPLMGDFTIYGGLYREVNVICTNRNHFDLMYYGTNGVIVQTDVDEEGNGVIDLELKMVIEKEAHVKLVVYDQEDTETVSYETDSTTKSVQLKIEHPKLWNGKKEAYLYRLVATIEKDGIIYDSVEVTFGFRKFTYTSDKGMFLNGEHVFICGVAKHQDFEDIGNAVSKKHMHRDMELIKEIGANAVRLSHYQHDQYTYHLCDQEGMIVWAEIPMLLMPNNPGVMENAISQLKELVLQNIHHPSICMWGIQNEIAMHGESLAMYQGVQELNDLVHELAPNAVTASANMYYVKNNSALNKITDIQGYNLYYGWYYGEEKDLDEWLEAFHRDNPNVAVGISEYGADCNLAFHSQNPKVKDYTEEFQSLYHERTYDVIASKEYVWGSFVWNMFDFGSFVRKEGGSVGRNNKGLVTFDRSTKKDAFYYYKAKWSNEPFIHICEKRFVNRHTDKITVKVYSNCTSVSLYCNGELVETIGANQIFRFTDIPLNEGENKLIAVAGYLKDEAIFNRQEKLDETYVFVDENPGINVANWFTQQEGEVDCFPEGYYSILDTIGDLMESEKAWNVIKEAVPKATERATKGAPVTLVWVLNKLRSVYSEEEAKALNQKLIRIRK